MLEPTNLRPAGSKGAVEVQGVFRGSVTVCCCYLACPQRSTSGHFSSCSGSKRPSAMDCHTGIP